MTRYNKALAESKANARALFFSHAERPAMNYRPVGGYEHSPRCDDGDEQTMCPDCLAEVSREWTEPEGADR